MQAFLHPRRAARSARRRHDLECPWRGGHPERFGHAFVRRRQRSRRRTSTVTLAAANIDGDDRTAPASRGKGPYRMRHAPRILQLVKGTQARPAPLTKPPERSFVSSVKPGGFFSCPWHERARSTARRAPWHVIDSPLFSSHRRQDSANDSRFGDVGSASLRAPHLTSNTGHAAISPTRWLMVPQPLPGSSGSIWCDCNTIRSKSRS